MLQTDPLIGPSCLLENNAKKLFQPRIGLAWDPTGTGKWAVRAAFGIHNDLQDNLGHRIQANPPFNIRLNHLPAAGSAPKSQHREYAELELRGHCQLSGDECVANQTLPKRTDLQSQLHLVEDAGCDFAILNTYAVNEPQTVLNPFDLKSHKGLASFSLNANFSYPLPLGRGQHFGGNTSGLMDKLIGGWQWNGIMNLQSGFPFTPTVGSNISGTETLRVPRRSQSEPQFQGAGDSGSGWL